MSTLADLWNEYWWVLVLLLMALCVFRCIRGGKSGGCACCGTETARKGEER